MNLDFRVNVPITRWTQKCAMCDQPITHGDADIEVEYRDGSLDGSLKGRRIRRVWHKSCYEQYLDMGEE